MSIFMPLPFFKVIVPLVLVRLLLSFVSLTLELEGDPDKFKLDKIAFMIGIITFWMMFLFGLPLLLLFINKKNFRGSLAWGWLAGLLLPFLILIIIFAAEDFSFAY